MPDIRIVTVTFNPAIDRVLEAPQFAVGSHVRAKRIGWYPAGKGINVARVLATLGSRCIATGLVGRGELSIFEEFLERVGEGRVITQLLVVRGRTRDNITIQDPVMDSETHIREGGFQVQSDDVRRISSKVGMLARRGTYITFGGSLPPGVTLGDLRSMLHKCNDQGAQTILDVSEDALVALRGERMWMAKLNAKELGILSEKPTDSQDDVIEAARTLSLAGGGPISYVIGTRGAEGAVLIGPDVSVVCRAFVHPGRIANTVGCGDALLAGLLHARTRGESWHESLKLGVATATANAVSREPGSLNLEDVQEFLDATMLEELVIS